MLTNPGKAIVLKPLVWCVVLTTAAVQGEASEPREIVPGLFAGQVVRGRPYDLAGKRIVFTNWYYVQPGDLDWVNAAGKSVYVDGDDDPDSAIHVKINVPRGIRLKTYQPEMWSPIELPAHRSILRDGNIFRGWSDNVYFESKDGLKWEHKAACKFDELVGDGVQSVFMDPSAPATERFKMVWPAALSRAEFDAYLEKWPDSWDPRAMWQYKEHQKVHGIRGAVSADGIRWRTLPDPLSIEYSDSSISAYYDDVREKYVLYTRYWSVGPQSRRVPVDLRHSWLGVGRRAIGRTESGDFSHFPPSELLLEPTPDMLPSETIYTPNRMTIPGAPDHHIMMPLIWNASVDDTTRTLFASSHDGKVWHWLPGQALIETPPFGGTDGGCIFTGDDLIELATGDWALFYTGFNVPHKYPRGKRTATNGYAVWPKGRLIALEADAQGQFVMMPVMPAGRKLKINATTSRAGYVRIQVEDASGVGGDPPRETNVISGRTLAEADPIVGDQFWTTVTWNGEADLGFEQGKPIQLRFEMDMAKIFGLEFE